MNQTVLMKLIERVKARHESLDCCGTDIDWGKQEAFQEILESADEMLKEERDQIEEAWVSGREFGCKRDDPETAEDYYNQTYGDQKTT